MIINTCMVIMRKDVADDDKDDGDGDGRTGEKLREA